MTKQLTTTAGAKARRVRQLGRRIELSHLRGAVLRGATWFKPPAPSGPAAAEPETLAGFVDRELHRPASSLNHRTVRFAGKAYHWRQDYTGQLKLAAGASPW